MRHATSYYAHAQINLCKTWTRWQQLQLLLRLRLGERDCNVSLTCSQLGDHGQSSGSSCILRQRRSTQYWFSCDIAVCKTWESQTQPRCSCPMVGDASSKPLPYEGREALSSVLCQHDTASAQRLVRERSKEHQKGGVPDVESEAHAQSERWSLQASQQHASSSTSRRTCIWRYHCMYLYNTSYILYIHLIYIKNVHCMCIMELFTRVAFSLQFMGCCLVLSNPK